MADRPSLAQKVISAITGAPAASRKQSGFRRAVDERRQFRRIQAPVYCRPAGLKVLSKHEEQPIDLSHGGVRVYSDEALQVGDRLTIELFVKDRPSVSFDVEVAWTERLPEGAPGTFDVGLKFVHVSPESKALLDSVLE